MLCLVETHDFVFFVNTQTDSLVENEGYDQCHDKGLGASCYNSYQLGHQLFEVS